MSSAYGCLRHKKWARRPISPNRLNWDNECSNGPTSGGGDVPVDTDEPAGDDELVHEVVVPVPPPREPAHELGLEGDDGCADAGTDEVAERMTRVVPTG